MDDRDLADGGDASRHETREVQARGQRCGAGQREFVGARPLPEWQGCDAPAADIEEVQTLGCAVEPDASVRYRP